MNNHERVSVLGQVDKFGIGKCSVPMWSGGLPAGFCDEEAYGEPTEEGKRRYEGYVPFLACPSHGGPVVRTFMDGDQWCAVHPDFIDLQNSPAGFGDTMDAAITALELEDKP